VRSIRRASRPVPLYFFNLVLRATTIVDERDRLALSPRARRGRRSGGDAVQAGGIAILSSVPRTPKVLKPITIFTSI
jgi:hypothetical protein